MSVENLMAKDHKTTNEAYRQGYDQIEWDGDEQEDEDEA